MAGVSVCVCECQNVIAGSFHLAKFKQQTLSSLWPSRPSRTKKQTGRVGGPESEGCISHAASGEGKKHKTHQSCVWMPTDTVSRQPNS